MHPIVGLAAIIGPWAAIITIWVVYYNLAKNDRIAALGQGPNAFVFGIITFIILVCFEGTFKYAMNN